MSTSRVFTVGQVLTAAQMNDLPQGILGKAVSTVNSGAIDVTETNVIVAPTLSIAGTTRRLRISFHARLSETVVGDVFVFRIKEATTIFEEFTQVSATALQDQIDFWAFIDSPATGSHTDYKVTLQRSAGTGTATVIATANAPTTIVVEDVGQV